MTMAVKICLYCTAMIIFAKALSVANKTSLYHFNLPSVQAKVIKKEEPCLTLPEVLLPVFIIPG